MAVVLNLFGMAEHFASKNLLLNNDFLAKTHRFDYLSRLYSIGSKMGKK